MVFLRRGAAIGIGLGVLVALGCSSDSDEVEVDPPGEAELMVAPLLRTFGTVPVGRESEASDFFIINSGDGDSGAIAISISGAGFEVDSDGCTDEVLAPGTSCAVSVVFEPDETGEFSGEIAALASPGGSVSAILSGTGAAPGALVISPTPHNFGGVVTGETSAEQVFEVENTGEALTGEIFVSVSGSDPTLFDVVDDQCTDVALGGDDTCTITVVFQPGSTGSRTASLNVRASPGGTVTAVLEGQGLAPASLSISHADRDFGSQTEKTPSEPRVFSITNDGDVPTSGLDVSLVGESPQSYQVESDDCGGIVLAGHESCEIAIRFAPTTTGEKSATLSVSAAEGGTVTSFLTGVGTAEGELAIAQGVDDFDATVVGDLSASQTVTIRNDGEAATGSISTEIIGSNRDDFDIVADDCYALALGTDATCDVEVAFTPTASGSRSATLSVSAQPGGTVTVSLNGHGLDEASLAFDREGQSFGSVSTVGSEMQAFTLENAGDLASGALQIVVEDDGVAAPSDDFSIVADDCGETLDGGHGCIVTVRFTPQTTGLKEATLRASADPGGEATVSLTGDAIAPGALEFDDPTVNFGAVLELQTATATLVVRNSGEEDTSAIWTSIAGDGFSIVADTCDDAILGENDSCSVQIQFAPLEAGSFSGSLEVSADLGGTIFGSLSGTGLGRLEIDPANYDFGGHKQGNVATRTFSVLNRGTERELVTNLAGNTDHFEISNDSCDGVTVGGSCTVQIRFIASDDLGAVDPGFLEVTSVGDDAAAIARLDGSILGPLVIDPSSHGFGSIVTGTTDEQTFQVLNDGANPVGPLTTVLDTASDFAVVSDSCVGQTRNPGQDCDITVRFFPTTTGAHTGTLLVRDDTTGDEISAALEGHGAAAARLVIDPASFDYGELVATRSATTTFTVTNVGEVATNLIEIAELSDDTHFTIDQDQCQGIGLGAEASCTVQVRFSPAQGTTLDTKSATLTVGDGTAKATASLQGDVISQLEIAPIGFDFGSIEVGTSAVQLFEVTNIGLQAANGISSTLIGTGTDAFVIPTEQDDCADLPPGQSCTVAVRFQPSDHGSFEVGLTAGSNPSAIGTASPITGIGLVPPTLAVDPGALAFGGVQQDLVSTSTQSFAFTNAGEVETSILTVSLAGTDPDEFTITSGGDGCTGISLPPNASCTVELRFTPQDGLEAGSRSATVTVGDGSTEATGMLTGEALLLGGTLVASPEFATFGDIFVGEETGPVSFVISNASDETSDELEVAIVGDDDYRMENDTCAGATLSPGATCSVDVVFAPTAGGSGQLLANLVVSAENIDSNAVAALSGSRRTQAQLELSFGDFDGDFGDVAVGGSRTEIVTLTNVGDQSTGPIEVWVSSDFSNADAFVISDDLCTNVELAHNESCTFAFSFAPVTVGGEMVNLSASADPGGFVYQSWILGNGVQGATLSIDPAVQTCGTNVQAGVLLEKLLEDSADYEGVCVHTVSNDGELPTSGLEFEVGDEVNFLVVNYIFSDDAGSGLCLPGVGLDAGRSCELVVAYLPQSVGSHATFVAVSAEVGGSASADVSATAVSALSGPASRAFSAELGGSSPGDVDIRNAEFTPATAQLSVTLGGEDPDRFGIWYDGCSGETVKAGEECRISIRFVPAEDRNHSAVLYVTDGTANKTVTVELNGTINDL